MEREDANNQEILPLDAKEPKKVRPSVLIDGATYFPPGWAYVLAFALKGVPWAVAELERMETTPNSLRNQLNYLIENGCQYEEDIGAFI